MIKADLERYVRDFTESLDAGHRTFTPHPKRIEPEMAKVFFDHRDRVIHVGVSDGIQEVTPEQKLGLWMNFPLAMPIEDTLSIDLGVKRDEITKKVKVKTITENTYKVPNLVDSLFDSYLKGLKSSYKVLADEWLKGEGDQGDVIESLKQTFMRTDNQSEMLFRTETTNYFNESRQSYFSTNTAVDYIELYAVTDGRISKICEDRHTAVVTILEAASKEYMPSFHPHCRTIQRPLISALSSHRKIIDAGLAFRASTESTWTPTAWEA